ncbi:MAG TPA: hypothetical protein PKD86_05075 [Gemmatales bacterium]|nr:hypothetical protein [Gemmatales bacterium]HMP58705.1 hypothetical protein [Gemmatales bacterium]
MKRFALLALLVAAGMAGFVLSRQGGWLFGQDPSQPRFEGPTEVVWPEAELWSLERKSIKVRNGGGAPLIINRIRSTCGCLGFQLQAKDAWSRAEEITIPAGASVELMVALEVRAVPGTALRHVIDFATNDPSMPNGRVEAVVKKVLASVLITPDDVSFGQVRVGAEAEREVTIVDGAVKPRQIATVENSHAEWVQTTLVSTEHQPFYREGERVGTIIGRLRVRGRAQRVGGHTAELKLFLEGDAKPRGLVTVHAIGYEPVQLSPAYVALPIRTSQGPRWEVRSRVKAHEADLESVTLVGEPPAGMDVTLTALNGRLWEVQVAVRDPAALATSLDESAPAEVVVKLRAVIGGQEVELPLRVALEQLKEGTPP